MQQGNRDPKRFVGKSAVKRARRRKRFRDFFPLSSSARLSIRRTNGLEKGGKRRSVARDLFLAGSTLRSGERAKQRTSARWIGEAPLVTTDRWGWTLD
jgi:hypothetical protein